MSNAQKQQPTKTPIPIPISMTPPKTLNNLPPQPASPPPHPLPPNPGHTHPTQRTPPPTPPGTLPLPNPRLHTPPPGNHTPRPSPPPLQHLNLLFLAPTNPFPFLHHSLQLPYLFPRVLDRVIAVYSGQTRGFTRGFAGRGFELGFEVVDFGGEVRGRGGGVLVCGAGEVQVGG